MAGSGGPGLIWRPYNSEGESSRGVQAPSRARRRGRAEEVVDLTREVVDLTREEDDPQPSVGAPVETAGQPSCRFARKRPRSSPYADVVIISNESDDIAIIPPPPALRIDSSQKKPKYSRLTDHPPPPPPPPPPSPRSSLKCPVCMETASAFEALGRRLVTTNCGHVFCDDCIRTAIKTNHQCPTCRKKLSMKQYHALFI